MNQHVVDRTSVHRILVIGLAAIGDVLLATPVLRALRIAFPKSSITYATPLASAPDILKGNPDVDECVTGTKDSLAKDILRMQPFDLTVDLMGTCSTQMMCLLSGARHRVGPENALALGKLQPYNITARPPSQTHHAFIEFVTFSRALGLADPPLKSVLILDEFERDLAKSFLHQFSIRHNDRWLAIQPGRRGSEPTWSAEKFVALVHELAKRLGCRIFIFQGPEDHTSIAEEVYKAVGNSATLLPVLPIRHFAAVLERCTLLVASEGGAGHVAAALGVKTIVLFTGQRMSYWFPYAAEAGMVALEEVPGQDLGVQDVIAAAEELLATVRC